MSIVEDLWHWPAKNFSMLCSTSPLLNTARQNGLSSEAGAQGTFQWRNVSWAAFLWFFRTSDQMFRQSYFFNKWKNASFFDALAKVYSVNIYRLQKFLSEYNNQLQKLSLQAVYMINNKLQNTDFTSMTKSWKSILFLTGWKRC